MLPTHSRTRSRCSPPEPVPESPRSPGDPHGAAATTGTGGAAATGKRRCSRKRRGQTPRVAPRCPEPVVPGSAAMPKARRARGSGPAPALPLAEQILQDAAPRVRGKRGAGGAEEQRGDGGGDEFVDARLSRRILEQARRQQEELEAEHGPGAPAAPRQRSALLGEPPETPRDPPGPPRVRGPGLRQRRSPQVPPRTRRMMRNGPRWRKRRRPRDGAGTTAGRWRWTPRTRKPSRCS